MALWEILPSCFRILTLILVTGLGMISLVPLGRQRYPEKKDAISRLDRQAPHRVIAGLSDKLEITSGTKTTQLWELHQRELIRKLQKITLFRPRPALFRRDKYALRYLFILLLVAAGVYAGPERLSRMQSALYGSSAFDPPPRLDIWITPPAYTGRPPIFLGSSGPEAQ